MKRGLSRWAREDRRLLPHVIRLHAESGSIYGVRRLREMLRRERPYVSTRRLSRLMSFAGLRGACCTRRMRTTRSDGSVVASDQVKRQFKAERPNELELWGDCQDFRVWSDLMFFHAWKNIKARFRINSRHYHLL